MQGPRQVDIKSWQLIQMEPGLVVNTTGLGMCRLSELGKYCPFLLSVQLLRIVFGLLGSAQRFLVPCSVLLTSKFAFHLQIFLFLPVLY
jgi:hypothetical protein